MTIRAIWAPLAGCCAHITTFSSRARALQIVAGDPKPELILLDVMMPAMSGYEVLARPRETPAMHDIPVIFVTSMDSREDEEKGLAQGAADYIAKPYSPPIILARERLTNQGANLGAEQARRMQCDEQD